MPHFQPFVMEQMMSEWENRVDVNLSESGVHPMTLGELLAMDGREPNDLADIGQFYPQANGTPELRERIAALYGGATKDDVLVTVGAAEANYLAVTTFLEPGDEVVLVLPNYMQIWGVATNRGCRVKEVYLDVDDDWSLDAAALEAAVTPDTKMIVVVNPNNPTGRVMSEAEMDAVVAAAERVGAWLLADEVYRGAERERDETPSFFGRYDKVLAQGSMSKAYGLPGLRVGWTVGPADAVAEMWRRHEYTTIALSMLSDHLTTTALSPTVRPQILARTRMLLKGGYGLLGEWLSEQGDVFTGTPPDAAAITFLKYELDINSTAWMEQLRDESGLLIVPGDHFGLDRHIRLSFAVPEPDLVDGLGRVGASVKKLRG
ncbi:MAG: aminotransferase class I/II-fold pyridoxal phosphate-dependent enzyme [Candidatus Limnocylindrales bacterium]